MRKYAFEHLEVWRRSSRLVCDIYRLFNNCRDYGFKDQVTRSSLSIPSNIAEGEERASAKESARFLYYSKGSAGELATQLYIAIEIELVDKDRGLTLIDETKQISAMLAALIKIRKGEVKESSVEYKIKGN
ncbi:four helix bundle protein [Shewanella eurypsychrophilus]|uniref:Four helix bundle protein n=1 Tax=Shewanella eurypsychrophilus TaxID=2593656 RepID=A0ABX6V840_9GAMM|nr:MULTISPECIES: four helix bundle protein [Shewanella]QPG58688.2 four helix bundle protein [Shewanella eurypsychrophilus]